MCRGMRGSKNIDYLYSYIHLKNYIFKLIFGIIKHNNLFTEQKENEKY